MKKGLTLVELLLTMTLAGLVMVVLLNLLMSLVTFNRRSKEIDAFEQAKQQLVVQMTNAVRWAEKGDVEYKLALNELIFSQQDDGTVDHSFKYDGTNKEILLDGKNLISSEVRINSMDVTNFSNGIDYPSYEIIITLEMKSNSAYQDVIKFVASQRKLEET